MKTKFIFILLLFLQVFLVKAQDTVYVIDSTATTVKNKNVFTQFDISVPLQGNKNRGEVFPDGSKNESWFIPDGINANIGYGVHRNKWLGVTANTGIGMKLSEKLVVVPVFGNLRLMPKVGDDLRIGVDLGLGKSFALGRGNLNGTFKRLKLNFESDDDEFQIFLEILSYGFNLNQNEMGSISIGISILTFN